MKAITLFLSLIFIATLSLAQQEESTNLRPIQGDKAIGFNFVGLTAIALNSTADPLNASQVVDLRYFFKDDMAFRLGFGLVNLTTTTTTQNDTTGAQPLLETENKDKSTGITIGLGAEKHIKTRSKRVDPFIGLGLGISNLGKNTVTAMNKTTQPNGNYVMTETETITPGGTVFGVACNLGFFWFFAHNIAFGASWSLGFVTGSTGGDTETTMTTSSNTGGTVTSATSSTKSTNKTKISALQSLNTGAVNILIKF
jgi:hypothetical protein